MWVAPLPCSHRHGPIQQQTLDARARSTGTEMDLIMALLVVWCVTASACSCSQQVYRRSLDQLELPENGRGP